jgi:hypothetical protein
MITIKRLSIPKPCSQNWEDMSPDTDGRYCGHCAKTVIDFTGMPTDEILKVIAGKSHSCGRFNQFQIDDLNSILDRSEKTVSFWRKGLAAASLASLLSLVSGEAKSQPYRIEQAPVRPNDTLGGMVGKMAFNLAPQVIVKGTVIATDDNLPLPGVSIRIKGTNFGVVTDANGCFTLKVPGAGQSFTVGYKGYATQEFSATNTDESDLCIRLRPLIMGEIVVVRRPFFKRVYNRFNRRPIRKLFH